MQIANTLTSPSASGKLAPASVFIGRVRDTHHGSSDKALEKHDFDAQYVKRLTDGDPGTERHFISYFSELLRIKLRRRYWSAAEVDDIRQETFLRVLQTLRQKGGLDRPECLGAFVNSVCNLIVLESYRARARNPGVDVTENEPVDQAIDMDGALIAEERKKLVHVVLKELPEADRKVLRMVFLQEADREEICAAMNVDRGYLRVLLHRALGRFKAAAAGHRTRAAGRR